MVRIIFSGSLPCSSALEGLQLGFGVFGELAGQARVLGGRCTVRAVAAGAGRDALLLRSPRRANFWPSAICLSSLAADGVNFWLATRTLSRLRRIVRCHASHDPRYRGSPAHRSNRLEILQLLVEILLPLVQPSAGWLGSSAVAVGAMAR